MTRVVRFFKVSPRERSVLVRSLIWVSLYRVGLWILPFSVTKKWTVDDVAKMPASRNDEIVVEIVRAVRFASRFVPQASCLTQALAARKLLVQSGQPADLKIGVAKSTGDFEAHAWLEIDGRIILGKERLHSRFAVLGSNQTVVR